MRIKNCGQRIAPKLPPAPADGAEFADKVKRIAFAGGHFIRASAKPVADAQAAW